jgi:hypothetical protein
MDLFKKFLILVIILLTLFIIYNLLKSRASIKSGNLEGFATSKKDEVKNMKSTSVPIKIKSIPNKYLSLPIREFIVKSSYNSAISGQYTGKDAIKAVLERGCRFIDFEIYTRDSKEYVSYSGDPEYKSMDTENRLALSEAFATVIGYSFSKPSPSPNDPLFVLLRIKNNSAKTYSRISALINYNFKRKLYRGEVNSGTFLKQLMGKVIIILDRTSSPNYKNYIPRDLPPRNKLNNYISMETGTISFPKYTYSDLVSIPQKKIMPSKKGLRTDIDNFMIVSPQQIDQIKPPKPKDTISRWYPQFLLYKFYKPSEELANYENLFNEFGSSFIPVSKLVKKFNLNNAARA